jgi:hypothetical protein
VTQDDPKIDAPRVLQSAAHRVDRPDRVLHYTLDLPDALVWEKASPAHRKRDRVAIGASFFAGLGLISIVKGHLPADVAFLHSLTFAFILLIAPIVFAVLLQRLDLHKRAQARADQRIGVRLELWEDRMIEHRDDRRDPLVVGALSLREVKETARHVFLSTAKEVIIVPTRAFATPAAKAEFAAKWQAKLD